MKSAHSCSIKPRRIGAAALVSGVLFYSGLHSNSSMAQTTAAPVTAQATAPADAAQVAMPPAQQTEAQPGIPANASGIAPNASPANSAANSQQNSKPTTNNPASFGASYIMQTTLGLLFVLALLMALAWVLKRSGFTAGARNNQFYKILAVNSLGPKEKIALLEVGDTWLLVGMTPGSINTLHSMPKGSLEYDPQANAAVTFAKLLERVKKPNSLPK